MREGNSPSIEKGMRIGELREEISPEKFPLWNRGGSIWELKGIPSGGPLFEIIECENSEKEGMEIQLEGEKFIRWVNSPENELHFNELNPLEFNEENIRKFLKMKGGEIGMEYFEEFAHQEWEFWKNEEYFPKGEEWEELRIDFSRFIENYN